ncbi:MAG TPA: mechanosensitive ion channel [Gammaproteobacteria bacterium]|nr:mechanosensitive ion channel [Gammaproteobacteria bacterium]
MIAESYSVITGLTTASIIGAVLFIFLQVSGINQSFQKLLMGLSLWVIGFILILCANFNLISFTEEHTIYLDAFLLATTGYVLIKFLNTFIWSGVLYPAGITVPKLITKIFNFFGYFATIVCIVHFVFDESIMPYLALTGAGAMLVGYTAQNTLGEIFAGLALNLGKNVAKGDFIAVGSHKGIVNDMDWRSVTLRNPQGLLVIIPNSSITGDHIVNYTKGEKKSTASTSIDFPAYINSHDVITTMHEALKDFGKKEEEYNYYLRRSECTYQLTITIQNCDAGSVPKIKSNFMELFSHALYIKNIHFDLYPNIDLHSEEHNTIIKSNTAITSKDHSKTLDNVLKKIDAFKNLSPQELKSVLKSAKVKNHSPQSLISEEGSDVHTLCVILDGECSVYQKNKTGKHIFMRKLHKNEVFGIKSFLTGTPRRTTIMNTKPTTIASISSQDISDIILSNKKFSKDLSGILATRIMENQSAINKSNKDNEKQKTSLIASIMTTFIKLVKKK